MSQELPNDSINPTLQISTQPAGHISNASNYSSGMENVFDDGILDSGDDDSLRQADDASRFDHEIALQRFNRVQEWLEKDPPWTPWGRRTFSPGAYPCSMPQNGRKILNNFDADTISNTTPPGTINPKNLMPQVETQDTGYIFPEEETSENEASETEIPGLEGSQPEESEREIPGSQPEGSESEGLEALVLEAKKSKLEIQEAEMPDVTTQEDEYDESNEDHPCASFLYANGPESKEGKKAAKTCIFEPHRRLWVTSLSILVSLTS